MKKVIYWLVLVVLLGVCAYSAYQIGDYMLQRHRSQTVVEEAVKYVTVTKGTTVETVEPTDQVEVNFEDLWKINEDVVAWLYGPDSRFNYPVVQGSDNAYYLYRLLDGTWNNNGSLFLDWRNSADFSDRNSFIYGHHMQTGDMFGTLVRYKDQSYYDTHPYLYLTTPTQKYRVDLFAGCVISGTAEIYQSVYLSDWLLEAYREQSTFQPAGEIDTDGPILTLSTCTYEFDNARYVVLGALVPLTDDDA